MASEEPPNPTSAKGPPKRLRGPLVENRITRAFSFQTDPFTVQHDPRFIVGSKPMRQALKSLRAYLKERRQLILITGEAGIGKTVLLDAIQRDSRPNGRIARIDDPTRSWAEIGQEIGAQLELAGGRLSPGGMVTERGNARILRIFIDSAQCLPDDALSHLQAYLDLEAPPGKDVHLLQLVLVARNTAPAPVFGWLRQREHQRIGFERLDSGETRHYILRRLRVAAGEDRKIFSEEALHRVAQATEGLPGAINQMCHVALDMAASRGGSSIDSSVIQEVHDRLKESRRRHRKSVIAGRAGAAATAGDDETGGAEREELAAGPNREELFAAPEGEGKPVAIGRVELREVDAAEAVVPSPFEPGFGLSAAPASPAAPGAEAPGPAAPDPSRPAPGQEEEENEEESPIVRAVWQRGDLVLDELDRVGEDAGSRNSGSGRWIPPRWAVSMVSLLLGGLGAVMLLGVLQDPEPTPPGAVVQAAPEPAPQAPIAPPPPVPEPPAVEEIVVEVEAPAVEPPPPAKPAPGPEAVAELPPKAPPVAEPDPQPVKIVRVPRPRPPTRKVVVVPKPPAPSPPPQPVAAIPQPALEVPAPSPPPARSASEVLERAFARFYDAGQTCTVEIYEHADSGELPLDVLKLARKRQRGRTMSLGVLLGNRERGERRILSLETGEADDKRFAYDPSSRQTVGLTGSGELWPFDGTHFRYDDFRPGSMERYQVDGQERSEGADGSYTLVSARPRHRARYTRVEFVVDTSDYTLLERHYYQGSGLRPYRIVQTPREYMKQVGGKIVPMRLIARDLKTGRISEAKVVDFEAVEDLDSRLFTLGSIQQPELDVPNF